MALYVIGDTHFSEGCDKPMDVFGGAWTGYRDKLVSSLAVLEPQDILVVAGDFSWGMSLQEALPDFRLLDGFPGKKLLLKGNHDYWWETVSKMKRFITALPFAVHGAGFMIKMTPLPGMTRSSNGNCCGWRLL